jgi:murein DD-endopeptidase MepM/ murein hydrolase activator NlpD
VTNPVPGYSVSTPYRKASTGSWTACGWHTGQDYAAPAGTDVVAARPGQVIHVDYGSSLGGHQFVVRPGDGTEDFYAHCSSRPPHGQHVAAGQKVADIGMEGNATGPHLHFERHTGYGWSCALMDDPMKSHNDGTDDAGGDDMTPEQAATLDNIAWLCGQIKGQTDQINPALRTPVDQTAWGVLDEAQGLRTMVADVQQRLDRIEAALADG